MALSRLDSLKIKAKLLQKAKQRTDPQFPLKAAYELIAKTSGYETWRAMKQDIERHEVLRPRGASALWNVWFPTYEEAKQHQAEHGGYLLPYQKQFFICDQDYIANLGLALDDPDLRLVGPDFVRPADENAWKRLIRKIEAGAKANG